MLSTQVLASFIFYPICYEPSVTSVSVTKAGLVGTDRRNGRCRTMGRGLSESRGSGLVREYVGLGKRTDVLSLVRGYEGRS